MRKVALFSAAISLGVLACGGGDGEGGDVAAGLSDCNQTGYSIWIGWYAEDTGSLDPTGGPLVACIPSSDGPFASEFLFGYYGCVPGQDIGTISGNRTNNSISGNWSGTVDGVNISGTFNGTLQAGSYFQGTWTESSGGKMVTCPSGQYQVAGNGTWALYPINGGFGGLNLNVSTSGTVTFSWQDVLSGYASGIYSVSVYDKQCVYDKISLIDCTLWTVYCPVGTTSVSYGSTSTCFQVYPQVTNPSSPPPPNPLQSGKEYIISVIAADGSSNTISSSIKALENKVFTAP